MFEKQDVVKEIATHAQWTGSGISDATDLLYSSYGMQSYMDIKVIM